MKIIYTTNVDEVQFGDIVSFEVNNLEWIELNTGRIDSLNFKFTNCDGKEIKISKPTIVLLNKSI